MYDFELLTSSNSPKDTGLGAREKGENNIIAAIDGDECDVGNVWLSLRGEIAGRGNEIGLTAQLGVAGVAGEAT